ncbi:hypothetical protein B0H67DRAFT_242131 [Lasiosphaeris hirsuta]|uniref:RING-type domain-containing protein n=1 Tax=Lasiosphaeris hirsuta TaxID=260670 RepID=A0AA40AGS3_9PEZI|nr:hypothetical protein B0H67DRAFT_242131 [Lasiosphaeris hirsuta]
MELLEPPKAPLASPTEKEREEQEAFQRHVLTFFPDICPQHLVKVATDFQWSPEQTITHILEQQDNGFPYPKRASALKRKRPVTEVDGDDKYFDHLKHPAGRDAVFIKTYTRAVKTLLQHSFPQVYVADIDRLMKENSGMAYPSHLAIEKALLIEQPESALKIKKTAATRGQDLQALLTHKEEGVISAVAHWTLAKTHCEDRHKQAAAERRREREELDNISHARAEGTMTECGCCFDDFPLNRMVHCDGHGMHWFCRGCTKQMAETQIGLSKYELTCMSMDGCNASFSHEQRAMFMDEKLIQALDRIEQESVLRLAGLENLASCPFCPFAAEYPPVEEDKEFRCLNPECEVVSCRLCQQETHVPKTCEEVARETGHSARHAIEEAMSQAMIRRCNKCNTPFIKEQGCNKMTCTRPGCHNVQCYVCSRSCDYSHFDDSGRGGKKGNCPLFDSVEQRHEDEVKVAEEKARQLAAEQNPDVPLDMFHISFSDKVKADEKRRKAANPPGLYRPPIPFRNQPIDNPAVLHPAVNPGVNPGVNPAVNPGLNPVQQPLMNNQAFRGWPMPFHGGYLDPEMLAAKHPAAHPKQAAEWVRVLGENGRQAAAQAQQATAQAQQAAAQARRAAARQAQGPFEPQHFFHHPAPDGLLAARARLAQHQQQHNNHLEQQTRLAQQARFVQQQQQQHEQRVLLQRAQVAQMPEQHQQQELLRQPQFAQVEAPIHRANVEAHRAANARRAEAQKVKNVDFAHQPHLRPNNAAPHNVAPNQGFLELHADLLAEWEDLDDWDLEDQKLKINPVIQRNDQPAMQMANLPARWAPHNQAQQGPQGHAGNIPSGGVFQEPVLQQGTNFTGLHGFMDKNPHQGAPHDIIDLTGDDAAAQVPNPFAPLTIHFHSGGMDNSVGNPA